MIKSVNYLASYINDYLTGRFSIDTDYSIRISADAFSASNQFRNRQEKERKKN